jgi:enediyne biosynthesis protein E4
MPMSLPTKKQMNLNKHHARLLPNRRHLLLQGYCGLLAISILLNADGRSAGQEAAAKSSPRISQVHSIIRFTDSTSKSKIAFRHQDGSCGKNYLVELVGAGLATFDADNDGWLDIYLLNGAALPGAHLPKAPTDQLFRNLHDGTFRDVTVPSGCQESNYGLGVAAGDFNNDGFEDLCITNYGADVLLRNNGDGTFSDVTQCSGVADGERFGAGVAWVDVDNDQDLDLFSANYVQFSFERHEKLAPKAYPYSPGPRDFPPDTDSLFLNNGDGTFTDISHQAGITAAAGPSMGVVAGDFDGDGDSDIFVCCDGAPNLLYRNNGQGRFTEEALQLGVAYDLRGAANGSMGVDSADIDGDGLDDLLVTDYSDQLMMHFRNLGQGLFEDTARISQIGSEVLPHVKWGVGLVDFDRDGDRDAFICNGHLLENVKEIDPRTDYGVRNCVMENNGRGQFRSVTAHVGEALQQIASSRGAAFDDLDNDGDIDCVILNCDDDAQYLENCTETSNSWLELELKGRAANRSAVGTVVRLTTGEKSQVAEVRSGRGYQSHYGTRLHFGWAGAAMAELHIRWPDGKQQLIEVVEPNRLHVIVQD